MHLFLECGVGEHGNERTVTHSGFPIMQHKTIESVLQRGEKLDNLVERSNALSMQSKAFYKTAKKVRPVLPLLLLRLTHSGYVL